MWGSTFVEFCTHSVELSFKIFMILHDKLYKYKNHENMSSAQWVKFTIISVTCTESCPVRKISHPFDAF